MTCATAAPSRNRSPTKDSKLVQLKTELTLGGSYAGVRAFLHSLETAPEFVVIDNVALTESNDAGDRVELALLLSTYFRGTLR